jgi:hypothetical protein
VAGVVAAKPKPAPSEYFNLLIQRRLLDIAASLATARERTVNDFEEFAIHWDAAPGEIRGAHKLATRLLPPDRQLDPRLQDLAECRMRPLGYLSAFQASRWVAFAPVTHPELAASVHLNTP